MTKRKRLVKCITLLPQVIQGIQQQAEKENRSFSQLTERILEKYLGEKTCSS